MALPLVLLLLMALTAFGHGALLLSLRELRATWAFRNLVRANQAAEIALHLALQAPEIADEDRSPWVLNPLVSGETEDGMLYEAGRRWLTDEFFLMEGRGRIQGWVGERTMIWLGWSGHPPTRMRAFLSTKEGGAGSGEERTSVSTKNPCTF
jgi:hypothetical protein